MIRQKSAVELLATTWKDAFQTVPAIRQCSLARFNKQACEFSTFAIYPGPKRSRTTSHRQCGPLSFPDQVAGHRVSIEPRIGQLVTRAGSRFLPNEEHGRELHIWFVSDANGFQIVRFTNDFLEREKSLQKGLFADSVK